MAAEGFPIGHVVWAKFGAKLYPGVVEPLPDDPDAVGKICVRYFPDMKHCSYVKTSLIWDYRENRERYAVDRSFKANKDWRKLMAAADKYLGITAEIPEPRGSTRNSTSEMPSETASTGSNDNIFNQQPAQAQPPPKISPLEEQPPSPPKSTPAVSHPPHAVDAIELPDEEMPAAPPAVDQYVFVDESAAPVAKEPPKSGRTSPRRGSKQNSEAKPPKKDGRRKASSPVVVNGASKSDTEEKPLVAESIAKRGRGRPPSIDGPNRKQNGIGESPNKRSRISNGLKSKDDTAKEVKKRGRPSLSSPKSQKKEEEEKPAEMTNSSSQSNNRPSLPPVCASSGGNVAFDEAYTSVHRKISSTDLRDLPKIVPPGKIFDAKQPRSLCFSQENSLRYGFIGLQPLSLIIVRHLVMAQKVQVQVWDQNPEIVKQAASLGATQCLSKAQVVDSSDVIFTSLLTERDAHEAFFTPAEGIIACVDPSKGIVDLGTPNVAYVQQINEMLTERRVAYLYCATFGNVVDAADCKLSFCVAGSNRLSNDIADLLRSLGGTYETTDGHWQDPTRALKAKAISDMLVAAENLAFCEALGMAQKCGLPSEFMLKVMRHQSKDHFSHCLPPEASLIGSTSEIGKSKDTTFPLPHSLSATAAMSPDKTRTYSAEALRWLTSNVSYSAAFAQCFSSLANEHGFNSQSLFVAMHAIISAKSSSPANPTASASNEDVSALFQRLASLI